MKAIILHAIACALGVLIHLDGRPLGRSRDTNEKGGLCGALNNRAG